MKVLGGALKVSTISAKSYLSLFVIKFKAEALPSGKSCKDAFPDLLSTSAGVFVALLCPWY